MVADGDRQHVACKASLKASAKFPIVAISACPSHKWSCITEIFCPICMSQVAFHWFYQRRSVVLSPLGADRHPTSRVMGALRQRQIVGMSLWQVLCQLRHLNLNRITMTQDHRFIVVTVTKDLFIENQAPYRRSTVQRARYWFRILQTPRSCTFVWQFVLSNCCIEEHNLVYGRDDPLILRINVSITTFHQVSCTDWWTGSFEKHPCTSNNDNTDTPIVHLRYCF